ncbi:hypothetical protein QL285_089235 [Trifolium repens]|nr:hypothetical protein QL285_089235 [Trifolium repens]
MNFWVWSPSDRQRPPAKIHVFFSESRILECSPSDHQRAAVARLRSERRPRCLFHFFVAGSSLVVAQRPRPDFEEFL